MKIAIFTANGIRHKFIANTLAKNADDALIISECHNNQSLIGSIEEAKITPIEEHFMLRNKTESEMFAGNDYFQADTLPVLYKEANLAYTYKVVKEFNPELMFVFGSSIIKEPLLSLLPKGRFINLHLGLSPYYRGSGTNFWPFINQELDYVGSTLLSLDNGIDTGDIIAHVRPEFELTDNVHTIGCKVIKNSVGRLINIMEAVKSGSKINMVKQWEAENPKYYRNADFNEGILKTYYNLLNAGLVKKYIQSPKKQIKLVNFND